MISSLKENRKEPRGELQPTTDSTVVVDYLFPLLPTQK